MKLSVQDLLALEDFARLQLSGVQASSLDTLEGFPVISDPHPDRWEIEQTGQPLVFDADAYNAWVQERIPLGCMMLDEAQGRVFAWRTHKAVTRLTLAGSDGYTPLGAGRTGRHSLNTWDDAGNRAWSFFTGDIQVPILWDNKETWMSLTPSELKTCWGGVEAAHGNVLIGGMGLGWIAQEILKKPSVESVTVVEIDPVIADVFSRPIWAKSFARYFDKWQDPIVGDLWEWLAAAYEDGSAFNYNSFIIDVWPSYGKATDDEGLAALKQWAAPFNKTVWAWGDIPDEAVARHMASSGLRWVEHPDEPAVFCDPFDQ